MLQAKNPDDEDPIVIIGHRITVVIIIIAISVILLRLLSIVESFFYKENKIFQFSIAGIASTSIGAGEDTEVQLWRSRRTSFLFRQVRFTFPPGADSLSAINPWLACSLKSIQSVSGLSSALLHLPVWYKMSSCNICCRHNIMSSSTILGVCAELSGNCEYIMHSNMECLIHCLGL